MSAGAIVTTREPTEEPAATGQTPLDPGKIVPRALVESFPAADLELVRRRELQRRSDSKFLVPEGRLAELIEQLTGQYSVLYAADQSFATYRTLYFDTSSYRCFHDHRRGRRPRYKVRIRHYDDRELSYLEVKKKRGEALTVKYREPRPFGDHQMGAADRAFVSGNSPLPGAELGPVVWTNFRRLTFVGLHVNERVTIDLGLEFRYAGPGATERHVRMEGVSIVEVKQSPYCLRTPVMQVLRRARLRPASASKYCSAIAFTRDPGRKNRLLPALRAIERLRT